MNRTLPAALFLLLSGCASAQRAHIAAARADVQRLAAERKPPGMSVAARQLLGHTASGYHYTSYGYNLLGVVLEKAGARTFEQLLAAEVRTPLGLDSVVLDDPRAIVANRAAFYAEGADNAVVNATPNVSSYKWPSGGLLASADDVARFASAHLGDGYLAEPLRSAMFVPQKANVGLGWRIDTAEDGIRYYHHGGTITGGRAFVLVLPEQRVAVAMLTNMMVRFDQAEALAIARRFIASP